MGVLLGPDGQPIRGPALPTHLGTVAQMSNGYVVPWPEQFMAPHGVLAATPAGAALWKFFGDATLALTTVPKQVVLVGDDDLVVNLHNIAHGVSVMYGVTVQQMFESENLRRGIAQAAACGRTIDDFILTFLATGGENNHTLERDSSGDAQ